MLYPNYVNDIDINYNKKKHINKNISIMYILHLVCQNIRTHIVCECITYVILNIIASLPIYIICILCYITKNVHTILDVRISMYIMCIIYCNTQMIIHIYIISYQIMLC